MLDGRVRQLLQARGKVVDESAYLLRDEADGRGAFIAAWDEKALGPKPTPAELASVTDAQAVDAERQAAVDRTAADANVLAMCAVMAELQAPSEWPTLSVADQLTRTRALFTKVKRARRLVEDHLAEIGGAAAVKRSIT